MRRIVVMLLVVTMMLLTFAACKPGLLPTEGPGKPRITLERVDIMRLAPWVDLPAPTLMGLGFVFNVENPSHHTIRLENFKFAVSFEAPGTQQYMTLSTATTYDNISFAARTTSQYRVVEFLDSRGVQLALLLPNQAKMQALKLNPNELAKKWFTTIGDFPFGIKVIEGMAVFSGEGVKGDFFRSF